MDNDLVYNKSICMDISLRVFNGISLHYTAFHYILGCVDLSPKITVIMI